MFLRFLRFLPDFRVTYPRKVHISILARRNGRGFLSTFEWHVKEKKANKSNLERNVKFTNVMHTTKLNCFFCEKQTCVYLKKWRSNRYVRNSICLAFACNRWNVIWWLLNYSVLFNRSLRIYDLNFLLKTKKNKNSVDEINNYWKNVMKIRHSFIQWQSI